MVLGILLTDLHKRYYFDSSRNTGDDIVPHRILLYWVCIHLLRGFYCICLLPIRAPAQPSHPGLTIFQHPSDMYARLVCGLLKA
jgi:hypothetical protein